MEALSKLIQMPKRNVSALTTNTKLSASEICPDCGGRGVIFGPLPERPDFWDYRTCVTCPKGQAIAAKEKQDKIGALFGQAAIPLMFAGAQLSDVTDPKVKQAIAEATAEKKGLLMWGAVGTGKTHIAIAMLRERLAAGVPGLFIEVPELLDRIRQSFSGNGPTSDELLEAVKAVDFLVLDDLGAEKVTDWVRERLFVLINARYNACLPLVATTNLSPRELNDHIGDRTVSRLIGMCRVLHLEGDDRRIAK